MVTGRAVAVAPWGRRRRIAGRGAPADGGTRQSRDAGLALKAVGAKLSACLTSPKLRAVQTAELACEPFGVEPQLEPKLAGGPFDAEALAAGLGDDVLLVGHDPDFSMAVHALTGAQARMKKGGLAGVEKGELMVLLRPKDTAAAAKAAS